MKLPRLPRIERDRLINYASATSWGISDPERFNALMSEAVTLVAPGHHLGDNLFTWGRNNSPLEDAVFRKCWEDNAVNDADRAIVWRRYVLACAGYHCLHLPGDFVECGVYYGSGIKTVIDYLGATGFERTFWGYDSFEFNQIDGHPSAGASRSFFEEASARFRGYAQVRLVKGRIPDSFENACPERICYLHIDLNDAASEIATLERLFDRVVAGGVVILDDYEWSGRFRPQKIAEDAWFDAREYRVFPLPTGQGLVLKR